MVDFPVPGVPVIKMTGLFDDFFIVSVFLVLFLEGFSVFLLDLILATFLSDICSFTRDRRRTLPLVYFLYGLVKKGSYLVVFYIFSQKLKSRMRRLALASLAGFAFGSAMEYAYYKSGYCNWD